MRPLAFAFVVQILRENNHAHTEPVVDPTGVGHHVTAHVHGLTQRVLSEVAWRVPVSTCGSATKVGWKPRTVKSDDFKQRPWVTCARSKLLGRRTTTVTVVAVPGSGPTMHRAVCDGHNCSRDGVPCSCLLFLYQGPLRPEDFHPAALRAAAAGSLDEDMPSTPYEGLSLGPTRTDRFGLTPAERVALSADVDLVSLPGRGDHGGAEPLPGGEEDTPRAMADDEEDAPSTLVDVADSPSADVGRTGASYGELQAAFRVCADLVGDNPALTRSLLLGLRSLASDLREQNETVPNVLTDPSSKCNKR